MVADLAARLTAAGASARSAHLVRRVTAYDFGDPELARAAHADWERAPRDEFCPPAERERAYLVHYHEFLKEYDRAAAAAAPMLRAGGELGGWVAHYAMRALLRLGRPAPAADAYRLMVRKSTPPRGSAWEWGRMMEFLGHTDNVARGVGLFESSLGRAFEGTDLLGRLHYLMGAVVVFDRLAATRTAVSLRLPKDVPVYDPAGKYAPAALREWSRGAAAEAGGAVRRPQRQRLLRPRTGRRRVLRPAADAPPAGVEIRRERVIPNREGSFSSVRRQPADVCGVFGSGAASARRCAPHDRRADAAPLPKSRHRRADAAPLPKTKNRRREDAPVNRPARPGRRPSPCPDTCRSSCRSCPVSRS